MVESCDFDSLARQAHSLKGAAANIGADQVSEYACTLETAAKGLKPEGMEETVQSIASSMNDLRVEIERVQAELQGMTS